MSEEELLMLIAQEALEAIRRDLGGKYHEEENSRASGGR